MRKQNIYQPDTMATRRTVTGGWQTLSKSQRWIFMGILVILLSFCLVSFVKEHGAWWLIVGSSVLNIGLWWLQSRDPKPKFLTTPLVDLQVRDGNVMIGEQVLAATLRKVVLGAASPQGPAFLQLPWDRGDQWLFAMNDLPQVRQFLQQHLPHVQIIEE